MCHKQCAHDRGCFSSGCGTRTLRLRFGGQRIREINEVLATPVAERTPLSAKITTTEIREGDCINSTLPEGISIETVVIVPCAGTRQYRVLNSFTLPMPTVTQERTFSSNEPTKAAIGNIASF